MILIVYSRNFIVCMYHMINLTSPPLVQYLVPGLLGVLQSVDNDVQASRFGLSVSRRHVAFASLA